MDPADSANEAERRAVAVVERAMVAENLEHASVRLSSAYEALRDTAAEHGFDEAAKWFDSAKCAGLGGAKELREGGE